MREAGVALSVGGKSAEGRRKRMGIGGGREGAGGTIQPGEKYDEHRLPALLSLVAGTTRSARRENAF